MKAKENGWYKDGIVWFFTIDGRIQGSVGHLGNGIWHGNYFNPSGKLTSLKKSYPNVTSAKRAVRAAMRARGK